MPTKVICRVGTLSPLTKTVPPATITPTATSSTHHHQLQLSLHPYSPLQHPHDTHHNLNIFLLRQGEFLWHSQRVSSAPLTCEPCGSASNESCTRCRCSLNSKDLYYFSYYRAQSIEKVQYQCYDVRDGSTNVVSSYIYVDNFTKTMRCTQKNILCAKKLHEILVLMRKIDPLEVGLAKFALLGLNAQKKISANFDSTGRTTRCQIALFLK
jgi:hypothetical protein